MLDLKEIEQYYPDNLRGFKKNMLREYLQYKILEIIFNSKVANKLSFLGGTALRIVYNNTRFSEDLDFDNFGLTKKDFIYLVDEIKNQLMELGYQVETRNVFKGAYRCYIKISKILFDNHISALKGEKMMIQVDTAPHDFVYNSDKKILNKFDVFTQIFVSPVDILLSQKIYAVFNRKRAKGRDFFDVVFLLKKTKPNYKYLEKKIGVKNNRELKQKLLKHLDSLDLKELAKDVQSFLFNPENSKEVIMFRRYIEQIDL